MKSRIIKTAAAVCAVLTVFSVSANAAWEFDEISVTEQADRKVFSVTDKYVSVGAPVMMSGKYLRTYGNVNIYNRAGEIVFTAFEAPQQIRGSDNLIFMSRTDGSVKYGVCSADYDILIPPEYDNITFSESESILTARKGTSFYTFDKNGAAISEGEHTFLNVDSFFGGLATAVAENELRGVVNERLEAVVPCQYESVKISTEGEISVYKSREHKNGFNADKYCLLKPDCTEYFDGAAQSLKWLSKQHGTMIAGFEDGFYVVNTDGARLYGPFSGMQNYSDGYLRAVDANENVTLVDFDGTPLATVGKEGSIYTGNGVYVVCRTSGNMSTVDVREIYDLKTHELLSTVQGGVYCYFDSVFGCMPIQRGDKFAFVDRYGKLHSDFVFPICGFFECNNEGASAPFAYFHSDDKTKIYIDGSFNVIDLDNYNGAPFITERVPINDRYEIVYSGERSGIIDKINGEYTVPLQSELDIKKSFLGETVIVTRFTDSVYGRYECGLLRADGTVAAEPVYRYIKISGDVFLAEAKLDTDSKNAVIDKYGCVLAEFENRITQNKNGLINVYNNDGTFDICDYSGKSIFPEKYTSVFGGGTLFAAATADGSVKFLTPSEHHAVVRLNGGFIDTDAVIRSGRTLVPMRAIIEALGGTAEWNDDTKTASAQFGDTKIEFTAGSDTFTVNGETLALDAPAAIVNDRVMLPVRSLAEAVGAQVDFNDTAKCVYIDTKKE